MSTAPSPAPRYRVFAVAWLIARAFAPNLPSAILAYPLGLLIMVPYAVRGHIYETTDRNGMVVFGPYSIVKDVLLLAAAMAPALLMCLWLTESYGLTVAGPVMLVLAGLLVAGATIFRSSAMGSPVGKETPTDDRYQVAALAQRPGTRLSAIQLAMRLARTMPSGAVAVAAADNDRLLRGYLRLGFTAGEDMRVYWIAP